MKKYISILIVLAFIVVSIPMATAHYYENPTIITQQGSFPDNDYGTGKFYGFTHNCTNTGIMVPSEFHTSTTSYILTVASWVSKVHIIPNYDTSLNVTVNGKYVESGNKSDDILMNNEPQLVTMEVNGPNTHIIYSIFLQRRPSERRTRISSGNIVEIYTKKNQVHLKADLVKVKYQVGNISTYTDETKAIYDNVIDDNCIFYYGDINNPKRATSINEFMNNYLNLGSDLYRIVYIEDKIVAIMPYGADF